MLHSIRHSTYVGQSRLQCQTRMGQEVTKVSNNFYVQHSVAFTRTPGASNDLPQRCPLTKKGFSAQCLQAQVLSTKGALHDLKTAGQNAEFTMAFAICTYKQCKFTDGKNNPTY